MDELTAAEKVRIRLEEQYRQEIRAALTDGKRRSRFVEFLHTPLGLLLAGITVSLVTCLYTRYEVYQDAKRRCAAVIESLDIELSYRFSVVLLRLKDTHLQHQQQIVITQRFTNDGVPLHCRILQSNANG